MKKRLIIFAVALMLVGLLIFCACDNGVSPVEGIAVTAMPVTEYYRGDYFNLDNAVVTVYYENGRVESVPLTDSMISGFDSQSIGEQVLAVRYADAVTYITVTVRQAPIRTVEIIDGDFKKSYVQGQSLDVSKMNLKVEYTNGYSETVAVTESMIGNFDTATAGYKQIAVTYGGYTAYVDINVVGKSIANIEVSLSERMSYVVGDKISFDGVKLFIAYNNNTDEYIEVNTLLEDENFEFLIHNEKRDVFDEARDIEYVTLIYNGFKAEFIVYVAPLKATGWEFTTLPPDQPMHSAEPDWSGAKIQITYNNGEVKEVAMDDESVTVTWVDFATDITKDGKHTIFVTCEEIKKEYEVNVVDAVEKELIIDMGSDVYYQDGEDIDVTKWRYSVLLTNGFKRKFGDGETENPFVETSMLVGSYDLSTAVSGEKKLTFRYKNPAGNITLETTVTVTVVKKLMVDVRGFTAPKKTVYTLNEALNLTGGGFYPVYNDGTEGELALLYADMVEGDIGSLTAQLSPETHVKLSLTDLKYEGSVEAEFSITVVNAVSAIAYNAAENDKLKTVYILGEEFDPEGMVITVIYLDGTRGSALNFTGREWSFENHELNSVGETHVRAYYGDHGNGIYTDIPVTVTNFIEKFDFAEDFGGDFGDVTEGMPITVPDNAKLVITRQNGDTEEASISADALDYDRADLTLGKRSVAISYLEFDETTDPAIPLGTVNVVSRKIVAVDVERAPNKQTYVKADTDWELDGLLLAVRYDNGNVLQIIGENLPVGTDDGDYKLYSVSASDRSLTLRLDKLSNDWDGEAKYIRQTVNLRVSDVTNDVSCFADNSFETVCFEKEITSVRFVSGEIEVFEMEELVFPEDAAVKVIYKDGEEETAFVKDMAAEEYSYTGFDKMTAGNQSVEFNYLLNKCSFNVNVRAKVLAGIAATPDKVTVLEGVPISSDAVSVKLHYVRADGKEYTSPGVSEYWRNIELGNVNCTYDPYASFVFDGDDGVGYTEKEYEISYELDGVTVKCGITVRTNRKTALSAAMQTYPKQVYIEGESEFSLENGRVLIKYDNGTSEVIDLANSNRPDVSIVGNSLDPDLELNLGAENKQIVTITFVDANNRKVETSYSFVVKDRKYATVEFDEEPLNNTFTVEYGTNVKQGRPTFVVKGYLSFNDENPSDLTDDSIIDLNSDYRVYYRDENGVESNDWPTQTGVYTFVVEYVGDGVNNNFIDDSHRIEIYAKRLTAVATDKSVTFGDSYKNNALPFDWEFIGADGSKNPYRYEDAKEGVAVIGYEIYNTESGAKLNMFTDGSRTAISLPIGEYELRPYLVAMKENEYGKINYAVSDFRSGTLTVLKRPIQIVGGKYEKFYGDSNPAFTVYDVYDYDKETGERGAKLGNNGEVTLGGIYVDSAWTRYGLGRDELDEDVREYNLRSNDSFIRNYEVVDYIPGVLKIKPRPITLVGAQVGQRKYGQSTPDSGEYGFSLKNGYTMGWQDKFEEIFAYLLDYKTHFTDNKMTITVDNGSVTKEYAPNSRSHIGSYVISVTVSDELVEEFSANYAVTIEPFTFTVDKMNAEIALKSRAFTYSDYTETAAESVAVYSQEDSYEIIFKLEDGYSLEKPTLTLEKTVGEDVGRYLISVSQRSIEENYDFDFVITGDYAEFYQSFFADKEEIAQHMWAPTFDEGKRAYAIILPYEFEFDFEKEAKYARVQKQGFKPDVKYNFGEKSFGLDVTSKLTDAMIFSFSNNNPSKASIRYFAADTYLGRVEYNYLFSASSRNFTVKNLSDEALAKVYAYCFTLKTGAVTTGTEIIYTEQFDYEVTPKSLNIYVNNFKNEAQKNVGQYSGEAFPLTVNDVTGDLCSDGEAKDSLNITFAVSVKYNARDKFEEMRNPVAVINAGDYEVKIASLGNDNYVISQDFVDYVHKFTIKAIELTVELKNAEFYKTVTEKVTDENGNETEKTHDVYAIHSTYNGEPINPIDNDWADKPDSLDCYGTSTMRVLKNDALSAAPRALRIKPTITGNYDGALPTNYRENGYEFTYHIESDYVNYSVKFDKDYKFVIDRRIAKVRNLDRSKIIYKDYDGEAPFILSTDQRLNQIFVDTQGISESIDPRDLVFTFERDVDKLKESLGLTDDDFETPTPTKAAFVKLYEAISADDTAAGHFAIKITCRTTNNFIFEPEQGAEHYVIRRDTVDITLNSSVKTLSKQYDTLKPSATFEELDKNKTVLATAYPEQISNDVYFNLNTKYELQGKNWVAYGENNPNNVGVYAYKFEPYFLIDGVEYAIDLTLDDGLTVKGSGSRENKILNWNYAYNVSYYGATTKPSDCDGLYTINKKDVSVYYEQADNKSFTVGTITGMYYVYGKTYSGSGVAKDSAEADINNYIVNDANGTELDYSYMGFEKKDISLSGNASISEANSYFTTDISALVNANPNFNITNNPIVYAIEKLNVEIKATFLYNGESSFDYSDNVKDNFSLTYILDFADKAAFARALGIAVDNDNPTDIDEKIKISDWISDNVIDEANNKFITSNIRYYLENGSGRFLLSGRTLINAGDYATYAEGIYASNFTFSIVATDFTVNKKEIKFLGAERDYFNKSKLVLNSEIVAPANIKETNASENAIKNAVFNLVYDDTQIFDDAGSGYSVWLNLSAINIIKEDYKNYSLVFDGEESGNRQLINLTINKIPLNVTVKTAEGNDISMSYGERITKGVKLNLSYVGLPIIDDGAPFRREELEKQQAVKDKVAAMIDFDAIVEYLASISANEVFYNPSLLDYVPADADDSFVNYTINLQTFRVKINKIVLKVNMINPADTVFDANGRFSIIYDERTGLRYSETESDRMNYRFAFTGTSLDAIKGYSDAKKANGNVDLSIRDTLKLIWRNGEVPENYADLVAYTILQNGSTNISAGVGQIKLTDTWCISDNYSVICDPADIVIFPKIVYMGDNRQNELPFTGVSLSGVSGSTDNITDFLNRLTMLVKLNFMGMPTGKESEWVNIRTDYSALSEIYDGAGFARLFELEFADEENKPTSIKVGDLLRLRLKCTETFYVQAPYAQRVINKIESKEFVVRLYDFEDAVLKDKTDSSFIDSSGATYGFDDLKTVNQTYELRNKNDVTEAMWKFDKVSADVLLKPKTGMNGYSFELILYKFGTTTVTLGFKGGSDSEGNPSYGYYVKLVYADDAINEQKVEVTELKSYTINGVERSVLDDVNLFDGRKHSIDAYIDKVGYASKSEGTEDISDRFYRVKFFIDNRYAYSISFASGTVREFYESDGIRVEYTDIVDFDQKSRSGFILNECSAYVTRFTIKSMGIGVKLEERQDVVNDVRISPIEDNDVIHIEERQSVEDIIEVLTVNSNEGYEGRYTFTYEYRNVMSNQLAATESRLLRPGLYLGIVSLTVDGVTRRVEYLLNVVDAIGSRLTLVENGLEANAYSPSADNPAYLNGDNGLVAFAECGHDITYSRMVFDFESKADSSDGTATFILKSGDNIMTDMSQMIALNDEEDLRYRGISVFVNRTGSTFETTIRLRSARNIAQSYWYRDVANVDWEGKGNILTATYDKVNCVIIVTLTRGGVELMKEIFNPLDYRLKNENYFHSSALEIMEVNRYTGIQLYNQNVKLYAFETTEYRHNNMYMSDSMGRLIDEENIEASGITFDKTTGKVTAGYKYYKLADSDGGALSTRAKGLYLRVKASSGTSFRIMFANNTPDVTFKQNAENERGAFLEIRHDFSSGFGNTSAAVRVGYYKNGNVYMPQPISGGEDFILADGNEYIVQIELTDIINYTYSYDGATAIQSNQVNISIARSDMSIKKQCIGYIPRYGDLSSVPWYDRDTRNDDTDDAKYEFIPGVRYVGIMPISDGNIEIKEMILY